MGGGDHGEMSLQNCWSGWRCPKHQKACVGVGAEAFDGIRVIEQQRCGLGIAGIADCQADHLGRTAAGHAEAEKVLVLGDEHITLRLSQLPDQQIARSSKAEQTDVA